MAVARADLPEVVAVVVDLPEVVAVVVAPRVAEVARAHLEAAPLVACLPQVLVCPAASLFLCPAQLEPEVPVIQLAQRGKARLQSRHLWRPCCQNSQSKPRSSWR